MDGVWLKAGTHLYQVIARGRCMGDGWDPCLNEIARGRREVIGGTHIYKYLYVDVVLVIY